MGKRTTTKRISRIRTGLTMAAVASLAIAVTAQAGTPTVASRSKPLTPNALTLVEAKCPTGKAPVSGGYEFDSGGDAFVLNSAEGIDLSRKRWSLNTLAIGTGARATSLAYCSRLGRGIEFRSDRTTLTTGESATVTATCKRDEKVLSGGYAFVSSGINAGIVEQSFRADSRSWSIKGINAGENQVTLIAFAHCQPKGKVPQMTTAKSSVAFEDEDSTTATARCSGNRYALSGGFKIPDDLPEVVSLSRRVGAEGWRATAAGINGRDDKFTVLAYCAKK